jgi:hypothetical protein
LPKPQRDQLIGSLSGDAQKIARALTGEPAGKRATAEAEAFREWAGGLSGSGEQNRNGR